MAEQLTLNELVEFVQSIGIEHIEGREDNDSVKNRPSETGGTKKSSIPKKFFWNFLDQKMHGIFLVLVQEISREISLHAQDFPSCTK